MSEVTQSPEPTSYVVEGDTYRRLIAERDALRRVANDLARQLREITPADDSAPNERTTQPPSAARAEIQRWRDDAFENAAVIAERYGATDAARDIRSMVRAPVTKVTAQHEETGRLWEGPSDQVPKGYSRSRPLPPHVAEAEGNWNAFTKAADEIRDRAGKEGRCPLHVVHDPNCHACPPPPDETTASRCATCDDGECSVHPSSAQSEEGSRP